MIVGIAGCSRSGKSTLANALAASKQSSKVISLDDYGFSEDKLPKINERLNWEIPEAYDFDSLIHDINLLKAKFKYVFVEGILTLYDPRLKNNFGCKIFLTIDKPTFLSRRKQESRWGNEPDWFIEYVWSCYLNYGYTVETDELVVISGEETININSLYSQLV